MWMDHGYIPSQSRDIEDSDRRPDLNQVIYDYKRDSLMVKNIPARIFILLG